MLDRNAASVFPDPVGAMRSVFSPALMTGHASACARVGAANDVRNHSRTAGWKPSRTSLPTDPRYVRGASADRIARRAYRRMFAISAKRFGSSVREEISYVTPRSVQRSTVLPRSVVATA
jgi:hypothetical protein